MKLTKATTDLICRLERIIGDECYNPNSYDGWTLEEGKDFRYPVTYTDREGKEQKTRYTVKDVDKKSLNTMHYKFGSNNLFIGIGLQNVLEYLENQYDLDFNELTKQKK